MMGEWRSEIARESWVKTVTVIFCQRFILANGRLDIRLAAKSELKSALFKRRSNTHCAAHRI